MQPPPPQQQQQQLQRMTLFIHTARNSSSKYCVSYRLIEWNEMTRMKRNVTSQLSLSHLTVKRVVARQYKRLRFGAVPCCESVLRREILWCMFVAYAHTNTHTNTDDAGLTLFQKTERNCYWLIWKLRNGLFCTCVQRCDVIKCVYADECLIKITLNWLLPKKKNIGKKSIKESFISTI